MKNDDRSKFFILFKFYQENLFQQQIVFEIWLVFHWFLFHYCRKNWYLIETLRNDLFFFHRSPIFIQKQKRSFTSSCFNLFQTSLNDIFRKHISTNNRDVRHKKFDKTFIWNSFLTETDRISHQVSSLDQLLDHRLRVVLVPTLCFHVHLVESFEQE